MYAIFFLTHFVHEKKKNLRKGLNQFGSLVIVFWKLGVLKLDQKFYQIL